MRIALVVARETTVSADPCQRPLDDPSLGKHDELVQFRALDDFDDPGARPCCRQCSARPLIAGIGKDLHDERPQRARLFIEHELDTVAILNVGGMNRNAQQEAERVDEDMPLAPRDLLARVIALRVQRRPPFCAALALWLSMMAAVGLASRPSCSRTAT